MSLDFLNQVLSALTGHQYEYAACIALVAGLAAIKRGWNSPWMHTDWGGAVMVLAGTIATALMTALAAPGAHITPAVAWAAVGVGLHAAGGYSVIKRLAAPMLAWVEKKWPWMEKVNDLITWIWEHPPTPADQQPQAQGETK